MIYLQLMGLPDGRPTKFDKQYLHSMDFEAYEGRGQCDFTPDKASAMGFDDLAAALAFLKRQPECAPLRADGEPNRPLTATTWHIDQSDQAFRPIIEKEKTSAALFDE